MADSWIALTEDHVSLNAAERTAYRESLLAQGETDRLPAILKSIVMQVRGAVRSCRDNSLSPDPDLIPESAAYYAGALARYRLMSHFPGGVSAAREAEYKEAIQWLRDVAACRYRIEAPGVSDGAKAPPSARPAFSTPTRTQSREQADGV